LSLLVFYVLLAVCVSFTCSVMEATLLSVSSSYIKSLKNRGKRSGELLWQYKKDVDRPLAAILTLNTIANTLGATGAGAQAEKVFGSKWLGLFAVLLTLSILIFSEIIPKTLGARYWRKIAPATAYILRFIIFILNPFIILARYITSKLSPQTTTNPRMFREEITAMTEIGEDLGALSDWEEKVIHNILKLDRIKVRDILTPRTVMFTFSRDMTVGEALEKKTVLPFSRIPIYEESPDKIIGMVLRHDILESAANDQSEQELVQLLRPLHPVPASLSVAKAIEQFIERREHIFLAIDEYGGTEGIVTLEDTMEALLGTEIVDEKDMVIDMRQLALRMWKKRMQNNENPGNEND